MVEPIIVGKFGKFYGVRGWIKVNSFVTPPENILEYKPWLIRKNNVWQEITIESGRKHGNAAVVKLPGCNTPEEARLYTNIDIAITSEQLPKLPANQYYWRELIGLDVVNKEGIEFGVVTELIATGANDVLVVTGKEKRRLIPYLSSVIIEVNRDRKIIVVDWGEDY